MEMYRVLLVSTHHQRQEVGLSPGGGRGTHHQSGGVRFEGHVEGFCDLDHVLLDQLLGRRCHAHLHENLRKITENETIATEQSTGGKLDTPADKYTLTQPLQARPPFGWGFPHDNNDNMTP